MPEPLTEEEKQRLEERLFELKQEHRDLDDVINRLQLSPDIEELQLKRFKKRKLKLKDTILLLENVLIPDILA
ncbi:MAG: YdcH family protein [Gammaproteobacteria bacterium]